MTGRSFARSAAAHAERSCVKGRPEVVDGVQNPNWRPDPRIFLKIRPNPSAYKILRSVTTLLSHHFCIIPLSHFIHAFAFYNFPSMKLHPVSQNSQFTNYTSLHTRICLSIKSSSCSCVRGTHSICTDGILLQNVSADNAFRRV